MVDFLTKFFDMLVQAWNELTESIAKIGPWMSSTFAVADWLKAVLDWVTKFKLPF